jgi:flavodoxin
VNTLVVYDSQFGNTERIARAIADALGSYGPVQLVRANVVHAADVQGIDLMVVGCPTQGWRPTQVTASFIAGLAPQRLRGTAIACFDTRFHKPSWLTGSAARVMAATFARKGLSIVVPPASYFVIGTEGPLETVELERAATWARTIARQVATPHPVGS